ncbi:MAG: hypothetical protein CM15mP45_12620 [Deltaproteobacteria bacterium]|nr:MAG: hypothetical protein CM15mP45_12620 [Deltaproteobacteria bacterium]
MRTPFNPLIILRILKVKNFWGFFKGQTDLGAFKKKGFCNGLFCHGLRPNSGTIKPRFCFFPFQRKSHPPERISTDLGKTVSPGKPSRVSFSGPLGAHQGPSVLRDARRGPRGKGGRVASFFSGFMGIPSDWPLLIV